MRTYLQLAKIKAQVVGVLARSLLSAYILLFYHILSTHSGWTRFLGVSADILIDVGILELVLHLKFSWFVSPEGFLQD